MSKIPEAIYHLGYSVGDQDESQISVHTSPQNLDGMKNHVERLVGLQDYLGIESPFSFEPDAYGFGGVGEIVDSSRVAGWAALKLSVPAPERPDGGMAAATPELLPVVTTLSALFRRLGSLSLETTGLTDKNSAQLISPTLENSRRLNSQSSAKFWATIHPDMLAWIDLLPDKKATEARVRDALEHTFTRLYSTARPDDFEVYLDEVHVTGYDPTLSFTYPGDGTGFSGAKTPQAYHEGLKIIAANNDYPVQQIAILGGLAALSDAVLEL